MQREFLNKTLRLFNTFLMKKVSSLTLLELNLTVLLDSVIG